MEEVLSPPDDPDTEGIDDRRLWIGNLDERVSE